jgi:hypothetical protein
MARNQIHERVPRRFIIGLTFMTSDSVISGTLLLLKSLDLDMH